MIQWLWNSVTTNSTSHCPVLHSSVAARNSCTNFVAFASRNSDRILYTFVALTLTLYFLVFLKIIPLPFLLYFSTICGEKRFSKRLTEKNCRCNRGIGRPHRPTLEFAAAFFEVRFYCRTVRTRFETGPPGIPVQKLENSPTPSNKISKNARSWNTPKQATNELSEVSIFLVCRFFADCLLQDFKRQLSFIIEQVI